MELKTFKNFANNLRKNVYVVDTTFDYDENKIPHFHHEVFEGILYVQAKDSVTRSGRYYILGCGYHCSGSSTMYVNVEDGKLINNGYHLFTDRNEADVFLNEFKKENEKRLKDLQEKAKNNVVTKSQIARMFGIPFEKLIIDMFN